MRAPRSRSAIVVGLLTAVLAFVAVVQVRTQAEVVRSLEGQDSTQLAFLIDDLHRANESLAAEAGTLTARRGALRGGGGQEAVTRLSDEDTRLRVIEGLAPVHGPGVLRTVDAPLTALDMQDALNNLRVAGAEAIALNDHRVITGSVIRAAGGGLTVDGASISGPWTLAAIGEPSRLDEAAAQMTRSLRDDPRVRRADYRPDPDLAIRATVAQRPFVYGSG